MTQKKHLDIKDIMQRLPHRPPFLLIDRIVDWGPKKVVAHKMVTINEPYFTGHFPTEPIVPGVLLGESMAQASAFFGPNGSEGQGDAPPPESADPSIGKKAFLTGMNLKIKKPAVPGDLLVITVFLIKQFGQLNKIKGSITVDRQEIASADFSVALVAE